MISPILRSIPYQNFSQLHNFTLVVVTSADVRVDERELRLNRKTERVEVGIGLLDDDVHLFDSSDFTKYWIYSQPGYVYANEEERNRHGKITQSIRVFEREEDAQLATCGKIAFVGSTEEIQDFDKFNQGRIKLGRGKVKFLLHNF